MKRYTIAIMGSGFTKDELQYALETIANDIKHMTEDQMPNYDSQELNLQTEFIDEDGIINSELRQLFVSGRVKNTYFQGDGKQSEQPERWEIYGDEGECYYYDTKEDYIHDCEKLGIETNL